MQIKKGEKMYDIKWQNDLRMYINTFDNYIFEGNINDIQPVQSGGEAQYLPLDMAIAKLYGDDFCVVFYDHTKQSGKMISPGEVVDDKWFNSFIFYKTTTFNSGGESIPSPNIELFKEYYQKEYLDRIRETDMSNMQGARLIDIRRIHDIINDFSQKIKEDKYQEAKPFMFILPAVSRYMTEPGRPKDAENPILKILFNTTQLQDTGCKLIMFVDKMNDLPPWFESENSNSSLKKLFIPLPDGNMRETFFTNEMESLFNPIIPDERISKLKKFSAYTDKYSLRHLMQLRSFIESENDNRPSNVPTYKSIDNIDQTTMIFDLGQVKDPWREKSLKSRIANLYSNISAEIIGQNSSIQRVSDALKIAVTGVKSAKKNDRRPRAILFFAGPTGTGKTELTKQLAENIFQKEDSIIRFDMSEFKEEHTASRLFGAPPGYVGYEAGGELTKAIKQNPFSIVLFDEIDKASPRIWDKFLQILGDGRLTDGKGETVLFTQSIIVFTSNLGMTADPAFSLNDPRVNEILGNYDRMIKEYETQIKSSSDDVKRKELVGELYKVTFNKARIEGLTCEMRNNFLFSCYKELDACDESVAFNRFVSSVVKSMIENYFRNIGRVEVLGRIGEENIMVFNYISPKNSEIIAEHAIDKYVKSLKEEHNSHLDLKVPDEVKSFILSEVKKSETLNLGGREIVARVEKLLGDAVTDFLFEIDDNVESLSGEMRLNNGRLEVVPITDGDGR